MENQKIKEKCPLKRTELPTKICLSGKPKLKRIIEEPSCPWWINDKESCYCFWKYIADNSDANGYLPKLLQSDLSRLFACSTTKVHFIVKEAMDNLANSLNEEDLKEDLSKEWGSEMETLDFESFTEEFDPEKDID